MASSAPYLRHASIGVLQDYASRATSHIDKIASKSPYVFILLITFIDLLVSFLLVLPYGFRDIDWTTYMLHISLIKDGERVYSNITGTTGPLVYPGGHVWLMWLISFLPDAHLCNTNAICSPQLLFAVIYAGTVFLCALVYMKCKMPYWSIVLIFLSQRIHSLYLKYLFNDCLVTPLAIAFILLLIHRRPYLATMLYSASVSVKMSTLLYAPAYATHLLASGARFWSIATHAFIFFSVQIAAGFPFISKDLYAYITSAFDLSRKFGHSTTSNWKFLSPEFFVSDLFVYGLLFLWGFSSLAFCIFWFYRSRKHFNSPATTTVFLALTQLIGIITARSLHTQFYVWFYFTIPMLLLRTPYSWTVRAILWIVIEISWTVDPPNSFTSLAHLIASLVVFFGCCISIWKMGTLDEDPLEVKPKKKSIKIS